MVHFFRLNSSYSSIVAVRTESIIEKFDSNQNTCYQNAMNRQRVHWYSTTLNQSVNVDQR